MDGVTASLWRPGGRDAATFYLRPATSAEEIRLDWEAGQWMRNLDALGPIKSRVNLSLRIEGEATPHNSEIIAITPASVDPVEIAKQLMDAGCSAQLELLKARLGEDAAQP